MGQVSVDGVPLFFRDVGQGLPVLLLHGFPLTGDSFAPQLSDPKLTSKYRFIVPDHRGFGQSALGVGPTTMARIADDALAILDHLKIGEAVVGGVSMGGYAAMALLRADPSRAKALILIDTQATADDEAGKHRREETARAVLERGMDLLVETMVPKLLSPRADATLKDAVARLIKENRREGAAAALRGMGIRPDSREILGRFGGPTLVVIGEDDQITPLPKAEEMIALIKGSALARIPNAGHLPNQEAPSTFNGVLDAFLAGIR